MHQPNGIFRNSNAIFGGFSNEILRSDENFFDCICIVPEWLCNVTKTYTNLWCASTRSDSTTESSASGKFLHSEIQRAHRRRGSCVCCAASALLVCRSRSCVCRGLMNGWHAIRMRMRMRCLRRNTSPFSVYDSMSAIVNVLLQRGCVHDAAPHTHTTSSVYALRSSISKCGWWIGVLFVQRLTAVVNSS